MATKNIKIADLQGLGNDPLLRELGEFVYSDEGLIFSSVENPKYSVSFGTRTALKDDGSFSQKITVSSNSLEDLESIKSSLQSGQFSLDGSIQEGGLNFNPVEYTYIFTNMETNLTYEELLTTGADPTTDLLNVEFEYNFRDAKYEEILQGVTDHNLIPSMYDLLQQEYLEGRDPNGDAFKENKLRGAIWETLQGNILASSITPLSPFTGPSAPPAGSRTSRPTAQPETRDFSSLTNQIFTSENNDFIKRNDGVRNLFPMYCRINMPYQTDTSIAAAIHRSGLGACIARDFYESDINSIGIPADFVESKRFDYSYAFYDNDGFIRVENANADSKTSELQSWIDNDLPGWYEGLALTSRTTFIGNETQQADTSVNGGPLALAWRAAVLENQLENVVEEGMPRIISTPAFLPANISFKAGTIKDAEDMLRGKECHSEILFYKVEKYLGEGLDNKIQTFIFSNTEDLVKEIAGIEDEKRISFVDTQVKFNQVYTYSVSVVLVVIANKYYYDDLKISEIELGESMIGQSLLIPRLADASGKLEATVNIRPHFRLVEMPYFQTSGRILSDPPLSPELNFIPIKGQTDKIMFHMNTNMGSQDLVPIALNQSEQEVIDQITTNQRRNDGLLTFETDDHNRGYLIYRMAEKPTSYQDFERNFLTFIPTTGDGLTNIKEAGSATSIIKQTTNRKYYYTFRSVDVHGLRSNPSEVYEIELYNDGGAGYPVIRGYEFGQENPKTTTKSARKMIQIVPRITQAVLNEQASDILNSDGTTSVRGKTNMSLGVEDESLFATTSGYGVKTGKRFKIRLISKSTGKKVDLNVDFNTNRVRSEIE